MTRRRRPRRGGRSRPDPQAGPDATARTDEQAGAKTRTDGQARPAPESRPDDPARPKAKARRGRKARPKPKKRRDAKAGPEPKAGSDREARPDAKAGPGPEAKPRAKGPSRARRRSRPRPTQAIPTDQGVASRSQRGAFVESWWAERWVAALERLVPPARLARGQSYARAGQVLSLVEQDGTVHAQVQGSRRTPYRVTIGLAPLSDAAWERVIAALARRPDLAASLLAGEMPHGIDEVFAPARAALFPTKEAHLRLSCTCPDQATFCKHVAATCYLLGEQFDEDPFLLFRLRGRGQDEVLEGLRRRAGGDGRAEAADADARPTPPSPGDAGPLEAAGFWTAARALPRIDLPTERPDLSLLRRLGPFSALDDDLVERLGPAYRNVAEAAAAAFDVADTAPTDDDGG